MQTFFGRLPTMVQIGPVNEFLVSTIVAWSVLALVSGDAIGQSTNVIIVESSPHHLGDGTGNEGIIFQKGFAIPSAFDSATLQFDFQGSFGPNFESPPLVSINGTSAGSISPFFPSLNENPSC